MRKIADGLISRDVRFLPELCRIGNQPVYTVLQFFWKDRNGDFFNLCRVGVEDDRTILRVCKCCITKAPGKKRIKNTRQEVLLAWNYPNEIVCSDEIFEPCVRVCTFTKSSRTGDENHPLLKSQVRQMFCLLLREIEAPTRQICFLYLRGAQIGNSMSCIFHKSSGEDIAKKHGFAFFADSRFCMRTTNKT